MIYELGKQLELKQKELAESKEKVKELQNVPLKENKELIESVEKQQQQMKEMQKALIDQSK